MLHLKIKQNKKQTIIIQILHPDYIKMYYWFRWGEYFLLINASNIEIHLTAIKTSLKNLDSTMTNKYLLNSILLASFFF